MSNKLVFDLDQRILRGLQNVIGAVVLGPPRLLGLPKNVWSTQVVTGEARSEVTAMRTAFMINRFRRTCINFFFILSPFLWVGALLVAGVQSAMFAGAGEGIYSILPDKAKSIVGGKVSAGTTRAGAFVSTLRARCVDAVTLSGDSEDQVNGCINGSIDDAIRAAKRDWPAKPNLAGQLNDYVRTLEAGKVE